MIVKFFFSKYYNYFFKFKSQLFDEFFANKHDNIDDLMKARFESKLEYVLTSTYEGKALIEDIEYANIRKES